jgi:putative transcriptional regulator
MARRLPAVTPTSPSPLRAARRAAGLTQAELGASVGLSKQAISQYESGRLVPTAEVALRLAGALGLHPRALRPDLPWPG